MCPASENGRDGSGKYADQVAEQLCMIQCDLLLLTSGKNSRHSYGNRATISSDNILCIIPIHVYL